MKKIKTLVLNLLMVLLFLSCADNSTSSPSDLLGGTPDALIQEAGADLLGFSSKRYRDDIIERLYQEALEKKDKLKALEEQMDDLGDKKIQELQPYEKYLATNEEYWSTVYQYIGYLSDTTQQVALRTLFNQLKTDYNTSVEPHHAKITSLKNKEEAMVNQKIILKLLVTADLMQNYEENELPALAPLDNLIQEYDAATDAAKVYGETVLLK